MCNKPLTILPEFTSSSLKYRMEYHSLSSHGIQSLTANDIQKIYLCCTSRFTQEYSGHPRMQYPIFANKVKDDGHELDTPALPRLPWPSWLTEISDSQPRCALDLNYYKSMEVPQCTTLPISNSRNQHVRKPPDPHRLLFETRATIGSDYTRI